MSNAVKYQTAIAGFGTWRIAYEPQTRKWALAYNVRVHGEQWVPVGDFVLAETAALAVSERKTGARSWDGLRFALPAKFDLRHWTTAASEGIQEDAST